jgi:hypothetical protein
MIDYAILQCVSSRLVVTTFHQKLSTKMEYLCRTHGITGYHTYHEAAALKTIPDIPRIWGDRNQDIPVINVGYNTQNVFSFNCLPLALVSTLQNYVNVYLILFALGVSEYFLKLRGVKRQEHNGDTYQDDMWDYVVKMGPHSVLPTTNLVSSQGRILQERAGHVGGKPVHHQHCTCNIFIQEPI